MVNSRFTELLQKIVQQRHLAVFLHLMQGHGVEDWLNEAAVVGNHRNPESELRLSIYSTKLELKNSNLKRRFSLELDRVVARIEDGKF